MDTRRVVQCWLGTALLAATPAAGTELFDSETKLTASDAGTADRFGWSVAIDGQLAVVGAPNGSTGTGYLFDVSTGNELFVLTALDGVGADRFGVSAAISGNTAILGADSDDDAGMASGSAYLFDATTGTQLFKLTASDAELGDLFGWSVGVSGNTAIVGAYAEDHLCPEMPFCNAGAAYLFEVSTGEQLFKLVASDAEFQDQFGWSVAISGNTAVVGADAGGGPANSGAVYLYDVTTGQELLELNASDAAAADRFGWSVAISGDRVIVGAPFGPGGLDTGVAYLFDVTTGNELFKLTASDAVPGDRFGYSVSISGGTAVVGAYLNDEAGGNAGSVYVFDVATGAQLVKLTASDADSADEFGRSVGISGDTAVVGAWLDEVDMPGHHPGSAYLFGPGGVGSDLDLSWYSMDCGGGVSIGGSYEIISFIGQPDAGKMSGGGASPAGDANFSMTGGFGGVVQDVALPSCPADIDGDGAVAFGDLLAVLSAWGPCVACPADIDENGAVDFGDLLIVLSGWGPCR